MGSKASGSDSFGCLALSESFSVSEQQFALYQARLTLQSSPQAVLCTEGSSLGIVFFCYCVEDSSHGLLSSGHL